MVYYSFSSHIMNLAFLALRELLSEFMYSDVYTLLRDAPQIENRIATTKYLWNPSPARRWIIILNYQFEEFVSVFFSCLY